MKQKPSILTRCFVKLYLWAAEKLYHSFAWAYDLVSTVVSFGYWSEWRLAALDYIPPGKILEIGFGTGELLIEMAKRGYRSVGLELSLQMHKVTAQKIRKLGINVSRVRGQTQAIPFASASFDSVIATFPSNYIAAASTLKEIHRVLRKNGRAVIVGFNARFTSPIKRWLTTWYISDRGMQMTQYLVHKAEAHGFKARILSHEVPAYSLAVMILECCDA